MAKATAHPDHRLISSEDCCWLKESIPAAKPDDCCTSGLVRRDISLEPNTNRVGGDYTSLNITNDIAYCRQLCDADEPCVAWTFVHPGVQGPQARCWLKKTIPPPRASECCDSGVK
jgi:PAN domain